MNSRNLPFTVFFFSLFPFSFSLVSAQQNNVDSANTYTAMAKAYYLKADYQNAIDYYNKALNSEMLKGSNSNAAMILSNIGLINEAQGNLTKALDCFFRAQKIAEDVKDKKMVALSTGYIGDVYFYQDNYPEALNYLGLSLRLSQEAGDKKGEAYNLERLSNLYLTAQKKYADTKQNVLKSEKDIKIADSISYHKGMNEANERLSEQMGKLEAKYEYDKQLAIQQADAANTKALADAKSNKQRIIIMLVGALAVAVAMIALLILRSLKTTRKEKLLAERQKTEMELKALRAQMNPHFIFNAINSIQNFILNNDSKAAHRHLSQFSKLIRKVLENSRYETIPLAEEIRMLELYLELESLRFSSKFSYKIILDDSVNAEKALISPLIIQPFVENAIWHGLMHLKDKQGELSIAFEQRNGSLKCVIDDNGIGRHRSFELKKEKTPHESMGLNLAKERLQIVNMLHKAKMSIKFTDKMNGDGSPSGTMVELLMPVISNQIMYA